MLRRHTVGGQEPASCALDGVSRELCAPQPLRRLSGRGASCQDVVNLVRCRQPLSVEAEDLHDGPHGGLHLFALDRRGIGPKAVQQVGDLGEVQGGSWSDAQPVGQPRTGIAPDLRVTCDPPLRFCPPRCIHQLCGEPRLEGGQIFSAADRLLDELVESFGMEQRPAGDGVPQAVDFTGRFRHALAHVVLRAFGILGLQGLAGEIPRHGLAGGGRRGGPGPVAQHQAGDTR